MQRHIPVPLAPTDPLTDCRGEPGRLFIIDPRKMIPEDPPPFQDGLHLHLIILGQRHGGPSAPLGKIGCAHGESCAAENSVQSQMLLGKIEKAVAQGVAGIIEPGHHPFFVFRAQIALDKVRPAFVKVLAVDFPEHIIINQVVRVENHHQVIPVTIIDQIQRFFQGNGLSGRSVRRFLVRFDDSGAEASRFFRGSVRAVIRDNIVIIQISGIIHFFQIPDNVPDHLFLIMGGNQHQKTHLRIMIRIILFCFSESPETDRDLIKQAERQKDAADS